MEEKVKILVVDDEEIIRDGCREVLSKNGYEIDMAEDGNIGFKKLEGKNFDLVLLDLKMPGISGMDFLEGVRRIDTDIVNIVITGYASIESAVEAMNLGAYDYIPKPFEPEQLRQVVKRAIEKRKLIKEAKRLRKQQEQFILMVYHELKAPLSVVRGYLHNLIKNEVIYENKEFNKMVTRSLQRIDSLIQLSEDILNYSLLKEDKVRQNIELISIKSVLNDAIECVAEESKKREINIEISVPDGIPSLKADKEDIKKVSINLLANAVKYNKDGGSVFIEAGKEKNFTFIKVKDTGIGMKKENINRIFDEFYRVRDEKTRMITGTGLGLSIVKNIIDAYSGYIEVESEPNKGSVFTAYFPIS